MIIPIASLEPHAAGTALESFAYDNRTVRDFTIATVVWGIVGMLVGVVVATLLAFPTLTGDISWLTYGRLRPLHTNAVIFAFACNAIFAGVYYSSQRLLKARMFSDRLSRFHFWGWQAIIVAAVITLPLGITSGKEYAELEWPIDIAIAVVWLAFGINFIGTIYTRRERHLYVAIWFYLATWIGVLMLHTINSLEMPISLTKSYPVYAGIQDAIVQWWYGHNAVAFILTTPFLGLMYYFIPKAAERPVYSYRLSIVHFWSLIFIYIWAGPHHLLNSALPEWAQTLGVVFSIMLIGPSWGGMINGLLTLRGAWDKVARSPELKFFVAAVTFYGMATFEGCLLALRETNALSHNTDWTIGHVHNGALGWVALMTFGMIYWMLPRLTRSPLWSAPLANVHFWLATVGIAAYAVAMWTAGITQGLMQLEFDNSGHLVYRDWMEIVRATIPFYWIRVGGGLLFLTGMILCAINVWRTLALASPVADEAVQAPALLPEHTREAGSLLDQALDQPNLRERSNALHGLVERWPTLMIALTAIALAIGGLCEIVPTLIQGALTPRISSVTPYTPLELTGRDLYIREGCSTCHTQMIRTLRAETERYGEYTRAGEHIYDRPFLWGSKRTGPDLARIGKTKPGAGWHYFHLEQPTSVSPGSIMPNFPWLCRDDADLSTLSRKLRMLAGFPAFTPYSGEQIDHAVDEARAQAKRIADELRKEPRLAEVKDLQDKEVVAVIAYLLRLGTDFEKATPTEKAEAR
jgi:cytochrome c oxidase cbb3-type subunit I/II